MLTGKSQKEIKILNISFPEWESIPQLRLQWHTCAPAPRLSQVSARILDIVNWVAELNAAFCFITVSRSVAYIHIKKGKDLFAILSY